MQRAGPPKWSLVAKTIEAAGSSCPASCSAQDWDMVCPHQRTCRRTRTAFCRQIVSYIGRLDGPV